MDNNGRIENVAPNNVAPAIPAKPVANLDSGNANEKQRRAPKKWLVSVIGIVICAAIFLAVKILILDNTQSTNKTVNEKTTDFGKYTVEVPEGFSSELVDFIYDSVQVTNHNSSIKISTHDDSTSNYTETKSQWLEMHDDGITTTTKNYNGNEYIVQTEYDKEDDHTYIDAITPLPGSNGYIRITAHFEGDDTNSFEKYVPDLIKTIKHLE